VRFLDVRAQELLLAPDLGANKPVKHKKRGRIAR
jgi:hypothetical protein